MDLGDYKQFGKEDSSGGGEAESGPRSRRAPVLLAATIQFARRKCPVKVRNISDKGALIEGDLLPQEGATGVFSRNDLLVDFTVVWVEGRYAGIAFVRALDRDEVMRHIPQSKSSERFTPPQFKRPGFACRPLTDYERKNLERWMNLSPASPGS